MTESFDVAVVEEVIVILRIIYIYRFLYLQLVEYMNNTPTVSALYNANCLLKIEQSDF